MRLTFSLIALLLIVRPVFGQSVQVIGGNVFWKSSAGQIATRLTTTGHDTEPTLSPDGQKVAFLRNTDDSIGSGSGLHLALDVWIIGIDGKNERRVLQAREDQDPERTLAGLTNLQFSPDGRTLYVVGAGWATSWGVHAVDVASGKDWFVTAGDSVEVIRSGRYNGDLVIRQGRHRPNGGGMYDVILVVDPHGRDVAVVGEADAPGFELRLARFRGDTTRH